MQIIMTTAEAVSSKNYIARLMNESARIAQVMGKEEEAQMYIKAAADFIGGKDQDFDGEGIMSISYNETHVTIDVSEELVIATNEYLADVSSACGDFVIAILPTVMFFAKRVTHLAEKFNSVFEGVRQKYITNKGN